MVNAAVNDVNINLPDAAIDVRGLSKTYKATGRQEANLALDNITLAIPRGSIFGLLGPNGAGKSTFINILAGLVMKTSGKVNIWDMDIDENARNSKAAIGIVPQELNIDPFFNPKELLEIHAGMYGVPKSERRSDEILKMIGLWDKRFSYARTLSGGMRRRLLIGKAMVHNPPILVLDEPTAGVDIELRQNLWENVIELNKRGTTIVLTTHYLEEAEEVCDRIAIINHGKLVAHDDTKTLLRGLDAKSLKITVKDGSNDKYQNLDKFSPLITKDNDATTSISISYAPSKITAGDIIAAVNADGLDIIDISTIETDLEDIFKEITSRKIDGA